MYAKVENNQVVKYPYNNADIRKDNPNVSFPDTLSDAVLASIGAVKVAAVAAPAFDNKTHRLLENNPVLENGIWKQSWQVVELSVEQASANIRADRDRRLAETDWRFRSDMNPSQAWVDYCQALRDIPQQAGFPHAVTWPTKPE